jgi:ACS family pantothenate transporter-like MFS transporter
MTDNPKQISTERIRDANDQTVASDSDASVVAVLQETPKRSWKSYLWDTFDKSPEERKFLFKLDVALMTLASLGYFIKYLDQVGLSSSLSVVLILTG